MPIKATTDQEKVIENTLALYQARLLQTCPVHTEVFKLPPEDGLLKRVKVSVMFPSHNRFDVILKRLEGDSDLEADDALDARDLDVDMDDAQLDNLSMANLIIESGRASTMDESEASGEARVILQDAYITASVSPATQNMADHMLRTAQPTQTPYIGLEQAAYQCEICNKEFLIPLEHLTSWVRTC